jgi:transposase
MRVMHRRCGGLDVHMETVVVTARTVEGRRIVRETRTFGTTTRELLELSDWLAGRGVTHVVMEATGVYWKPVWHGLEGAFALTLANAMDVKAVPGRKSDVGDSAWLADLLAHGLVRDSLVPPEPVQELRSLTRTRTQLVRELSRHTLRIPKFRGHDTQFRRAPRCPPPAITRFRR